MSAIVNEKTKESLLLRIFSRPWVAMLACSLLVFINAFEWRHFFVDDAFIGFRCIDNFLAGNGFVFNTGTRVESVTNIGWLVFITPLALFFKTHLAGKIAGTLVLLIAVLLVCLLGARISRALHSEGESVLLGFMVPLLIFSEPALQYFSLSGMETAFLVCLLAASALLAEKRNGLLYVALLSGAAFSVRPECLIFFPLVILLRMVVLRAELNEKKRLIVPISVWVAVILMITAARFGYFGSILPHTFYAKPADPLSLIARAYKLLTGERVNAAFPFTGFLVIPLMGYAAFCLQSRLKAVLMVLTPASILGFIFAVYSPEDWTDMPRYFAPYMPFAMFLFFAGLQALIIRASDAAKKWFRLLLVFSFMLVLVFFRVEQIKLLGKNARDKYPGFVLTSEALVPAVTEMTGIIAAGEWVAARRIGVLGYVGGFRVFDYVFGLPDRAVVEARAKNGNRYFEDPRDEGLKELWNIRRPKYLLEDRSRLRQSASVAGDLLELVVHGCRYQEKRSFRLGQTEDWVLLELID